MIEVRRGVPVLAWRSKQPATYCENGGSTKKYLEEWRFYSEYCEIARSPDKYVRRTYVRTYVRCRTAGLQTSAVQNRRSPFMGLGRLRKAASSASFPEGFGLHVFPRKLLQEVPNVRNLLFCILERGLQLRNLLFCFLPRGLQPLVLLGPTDKPPALRCYPFHPQACSFYVPHSPPQFSQPSNSSMIMICLVRTFFFCIFCRWFSRVVKTAYVA